MSETRPVTNIVFITYTTTGNTKFVEGKIVQRLNDANFSVSTFDALSIVKLYQLGRKTPEMLSVEAVNETLIPDLREAIHNADVLAVGGFAFAAQTPPGLIDIFSDEYLPPDLFNRMKFFFTFGTAGQAIGSVHDILATAVSSKNEKAAYLGSLTVFCPENFAPLQPPAGSRDMWGQEQLDKISPFADSLIATFDGSAPAKAVPFKKAYFKVGFMQKMIAFACGKILVNKERCVKCGTCARNCPYGALSISPDIEDGFPHWDESKCMYCHLCFNKCPREAIDYTRAKTQNKARHPSPFLDTDTGTVITTDAATHTVVGIPLPKRSQLLLRNVKTLLNWIF